MLYRFYYQHLTGSVFMQDRHYFKSNIVSDLYMYQCGVQDCAPGHKWGPGVRDQYIIHYITKGKGTFTVNQNTYHLSTGQGFMVNPDMLVSYSADNISPWSYAWVGFHGSRAKRLLEESGLTSSSPIFEYRKDSTLTELMSEIIAAKRLKKAQQTAAQGYLYLILSTLIESSDTEPALTSNFSQKEIYLKKAFRYIESNYSQDITVSEMASEVGVDRSYLYSLFKELTGRSPKEHIRKERMDRAIYLLNDMKLNIGYIAYSVGYSDQFQFSKSFKAFTGKSPKQFRAELFKNNQ